MRFAADVKWLQDHGVVVHRFNLSQNPAAFVENEQVRQALTEKGEIALPIVLLDGHAQVIGRYPERLELAVAVGLSEV